MFGSWRLALMTGFTVAPKTKDAAGGAQFIQSMQLVLSVIFGLVFRVFERLTENTTYVYQGKLHSGSSSRHLVREMLSINDEVDPYIIDRDYHLKLRQRYRSIDAVA